VIRGRISDTRAQQKDKKSEEDGEARGIAASTRNGSMYHCRVRSASGSV
jgi:hypothetical protein